MKDTDNSITFSFGQNWLDYLKTVGNTEIEKAIKDILEYLDEETVKKSRILDIGSGSGIHSSAFYKLGAKEVRSFDYDEYSVEATKYMHKLCESPVNWKVGRGSILDSEFVESLGKFDIVYSWGVLHHTGNMWEAIKNAMKLVSPGGKLWITLYVKGPNYQTHLSLKKRYNNATETGKKWIIRKYILRLMLHRLLHFKNPFTWNEKRERGMNVYHDIIDWLGGLPYEVASPDEVLRFGRQNGMIMERIRIVPEGGCNYYLFSNQG